MNPRSLILSLTSLTLISAAPTIVPAADSSLQEEQRARCYAILLRAIEDESPWVRVHAAEGLITLERPQPALTAFRPEAETSEPRYRIVVWRVLATAEPDAARQRHYVERIRATLLDPSAPDHAHAMEALAKLREPALDDAEQRRIVDVANGGGGVSPFAVWRLAQAKDATAVERLLKLLRSDDVTTRARAAYVLSRLQPFSESASHAITAALEREPAESPARVILRVAQGADSARELARDAHVAPSGRYFAAMHLAEVGRPDDDAILAPLLDDPDSDVRVSAAYALLQIEFRAAAIATTAPVAKPHEGT